LSARNNNIELEYETDYAITGFDDRHLTYADAGGENYNLARVKQGDSPYFQKYGDSRGYHEALLDAEQQAMRNNPLLYRPHGLDYDTSVTAATNREQRQAFGKVKRIRVARSSTIIELSIKLRQQRNLYAYNDNPQQNQTVNYLTIHPLPLNTDLPNSLFKQNFIFVKGE